jgi:hypothetical protein
MPETKIQFKLGAIEFSGEGDKEWLAAQLDKLLANAPKLLSVGSPPQAPAADGQAPIQEDAGIASKTLVAFLQEKNASTVQVRKFLGTSVWLESKGKKRLDTRDVVRALKDAKQTRLGNPADCLNQNVGKGLCEKDGDTFFVTLEGKKSLG